MYFPFLMASFLMSCAQSITSASQVLNAAAYKEAIAAKNIQVLDVRTAAEFNAGHIQNALQANWLDQKEFANRTQHLDKKFDRICLLSGRCKKCFSTSCAGSKGI